MLFNVPGATSSPGLPATVTSPGLVGCLNCRCDALSHDRPTVVLQHLDDVADRRIAIAEMLHGWLAPDYRYSKVRGAGGDTYLVRHDEHSDTWELTMFRAERADG